MTDYQAEALRVALIIGKNDPIRGGVLAMELRNALFHVQELIDDVEAHNASPPDCSSRIIVADAKASMARIVQLCGAFEGK